MCNISDDQGRFRRLVRRIETADISPSSCQERELLELHDLAADETVNSAVRYSGEAMQCVEALPNGEAFTTAFDALRSFCVKVVGTPVCQAA